MAVSELGLPHTRIKEIDINPLSSLRPGLSLLIPRLFLNRDILFILNGYIHNFETTRPAGSFHNDFRADSFADQRFSDG